MQCLQDMGGGAFQLLVPAPVDYTTCSFLLTQPSDVLAATQSLNAFNQVFTVPVVQDLSNAWATGFVLPMVLGLVAWAVALIVNFFKSKE